ncbi:MAG: beta-ketoacyl-[acyl-carrier-protein] synthase family protein [Planctomycetota bacterium]
MSARVVITGLGALSALGDSPAALWAGLAAGRSGVRALPHLAACGTRVTAGGAIASLPFDTPQREVELGRRAADQALEQAGLAPAACGLLWAAGLDSYQLGPQGLTRRAASACYQALALRHGRPRRMLAVACASGTQTVGEAACLIRAGRAQACLAGGSSTILSPLYASGFAALGAVAVDLAGEDPAQACKPFDVARRGFALAEGAAALVLESATHAAARGARALAEVVGFGTSMDAYDLNRPPPDGAGAERCIRRALEDAGLAPAAIDAVNAHGTGTRVGDPAEAAALNRVFGTPGPPVSSVKGALGHAMAASGALEAVVVVLALEAGAVPPTVNLTQPDPECALDHVLGAPRTLPLTHALSCSFGMGGQNAALILRRSEHA